MTQALLCRHCGQRPANHVSTAPGGLSGICSECCALPEAERPSPPQPEATRYPLCACGKSASHTATVGGRVIGVLVHREMEFRPIGVNEWGTASWPGSRGIVPRRFVASVPIPELSCCGRRESAEPRYAQLWLRSWPLARRSGCSSAVPYPPPRSTSFVARPPSSRNFL